MGKERREKIPTGGAAGENEVSIGLQDRNSEADPVEDEALR